MDRFPLPCWSNGGNLTNAILTLDGNLVGIDQQVNTISDSDGLERYLDKVRCLTEKLMTPLKVSVGSALETNNMTMDPTGVIDVILKALKEHCGVDAPMESMNAVLDGMRSGLRKV